jgi:hypothetical protein
MSRSGYIDDYDDDFLALYRWRGQVASAIRGKRGQKLLKDLLSALDAMPEKVLIANELEANDGGVCALGAVGKARGIDMTGVDPQEFEVVAPLFDIAEPLAREIAYENDECGTYRETPEQRFVRVRKWVVSQIKE